MGKGKNSGVSSSKKITEVDDDQVLEVIENKKFLALRAVASSWPVSSTTEEQLKELADKGVGRSGSLLTMVIYHNKGLK